jgi:hypothetical protein
MKNDDYHGTYWLYWLLVQLRYILLILWIIVRPRVASYSRPRLILPVCKIAHAEETPVLSTSIAKMACSVTAPNANVDARKGLVPCPVVVLQSPFPFLPCQLAECMPMPRLT